MTNRQFAATPVPAAPAPDAELAAPCDTTRFIERIGGDAGLAREMARTFLDEADRLLDAVASAIAAGNVDAVRRAAHALKGAAGTFDAAPTVAAAAELERLARGGDLATAGAICTRLNAEAARLVTALREFGGSETCAS